LIRRRWNREEAGFGCSGWGYSDGSHVDPVSIIVSLVFVQE